MVSLLVKYATLSKYMLVLTHKFHDLWARMVTQFTDEYPLVLVLVVIMLLVPCDTSECERVFSLMNDLKSAERNRLNATNMGNLMVWHSMAKSVAKDLAKEGKLPSEQKKLPLKDLPVVEILKEFRQIQLQGRARDSHRKC